MKNYQDSDYAVNKNAKGIVYRFANQTIEVTPEDYLRENPDKTETDFTEMKALSDSDYYDRDRNDYRQTWKNAPLHGLDETDAFAAPSPEDETVEQPERIAAENYRREIGQQALDTLTDIQRRRYLMYHVDGLTMRQIADIEGVIHTKIQKSLNAADKKIKKILADE